MKPWFCASCSGIVELNQSGRCSTCNSDAVDIALRPAMTADGIASGLPSHFEKENVGKFFIVLILFALFPMFAQAQARILFGAQGGEVTSNTFIGPALGVELPFAHRFELDLTEKFSPYESHTALGTGTANKAYMGGIAWMTKSLGVTGFVEASEYTVTKIRKSDFYADGGVVYRVSWQGIPSRLEFGYLKEVGNKMAGGVEPSYFQGGRFAMTTRIGCSGPFCYRIGWEMIGGRVLQQGNPQCDGTFGNGSQVGISPCGRARSITGGASAFFQVEFPRRRATEENPF